mmetsp:Transcript_10000/g.14938  ORF Transcript_10000/g.14938 Transcript_10000/m.14938 type:complete len:174 (+) Transcript_10000:958-1479(+)
MELPDITLQLLVNELVKYTLKKGREEELTEALLNHTKEQILEKSAKLKSLGSNLSGKLMFRIVKDHVWLKEENAILRFICKEFWMYLFGKNVDRLQTNNRGVFIIYDYKFTWIQTCSVESTEPELTESIHKLQLLYLGLVSGFIKGGLHSLGINASVEGATEAEGTKFTITLR